jgi:predicted PurR-regulated permease PerM
MAGTISRGQWRRRNDHRRIVDKGTLCPLAGLLGIVLAPPVRRLEHWGLPNGLSVAVVIATVLTALFGGATFAGHQMAQLLKELPAREANLRDTISFIGVPNASPL